MSEGAAGLTLDSCGLTFTDALVLRAAKATFLSQVFRGGIEVPSGANVMITHSSISFAASVHTGVTVSVPIAGVRRSSTIVVTTEVTFADLEDAAIHWYLETGEAMDKAGAYGIQGAAAAFVEKIAGSVTNVIGLPLAETLTLLRKATLN